MMTPPQLPKIAFTLKDTAGRLDLHVFSSLTNELRKLGSGQQPESKWFHQRRQEMIDAMHQEKKLKHFLVSSADVRVLIHLWSTHIDFFKAYPVSKRHLKLMIRIKDKLSPSQIFSLIRLYFMVYDQIDDLKYFCTCIQSQLEKICPNKRLSQNMHIYCKHKSILFDSSLKAFWASYNQDENSLQAYCQTYHIPWDNKARFVISAKHHLYISPIENLRPGETSDSFERLCHDEIKNMPYDSQYSIGQTIAIHMMDQLENKSLPDSWRHFVMNLLGDPRMPKTSDLYQNGWAGMPSRYANQMEKWLSQMDMLVFLEILKEIGKQTGNEMIRRMFPSRKSFLESLYKTGMVTQTRLFLSSDAISFIEKQYEPQDRPMFAQLSHKNKSIIYMQVGRVHLIEGTHNYSARLLDWLPTKHPITNLEKKKFILSELATGLDQAYVSEFQDSEHLYVIPHDIHNAWRRKLVEILKGFDIFLT